MSGSEPRWHHTSGHQVHQRFFDNSILIQNFNMGSLECGTTHLSIKFIKDYLIQNFNVVSLECGTTHLVEQVHQRLFDNSILIKTLIIWSKSMNNSLTI